MQRLVTTIILLAILMPIHESLAIETSCDLITGASCLWKEGCDCDGDGFVVDNNPKYCHYDECPLDADDTDPAILGVPSDNNEDGDAWTTKYDCNDKDICIDKNCDNICTLDVDEDGFAANVDCDDENPYIGPSSPAPCCACDVILNIDKLAKYACGTPPCPYDDLNPPPDGFSSGLYEDSTLSSLDSGGAPADAQMTTMDILEDLAGTFLPPTEIGDTHFAGSGAKLTRSNGCAISGHAPSGATPVSPAYLGLLILLWWPLRRRRRRTTLGAFVAVLIATMVLPACQTIRPWQREQLAKAPMTFDADPLENQLEQHFLQYRESATGGFGGSGGGCGCN